MRRILNKTIRDETGQAFVLVLILLLLGGLIIGPLLAYMNTGLIAGQAYEERMNELYAADAGIEDALWKIVNGDASLPGTVGDNYPYIVPDVNEKEVAVEIVLEEDIEHFLYGLLGADAGVHEDWAVIEDIDVMEGTYTIEVIYGGAAEKKKIYGVGAWFLGEPYDIKYDESDPPDPIYEGMTDDYNDYSFEVVPYKGGTAFVWQWTASSRPEFGSKTGVYTRTQKFEFTPEEIPEFHFCWVYVGSMDIGVVPTDVIFSIWKIIATATDTATSKWTEVTAYICEQGEEEAYNVSVLAWEIDQQ